MCVRARVCVGGRGGGGGEEELGFLRRRDSNKRKTRGLGLVRLGGGGSGRGLGRCVWRRHLTMTRPDFGTELSVFLSEKITYFLFCHQTFDTEVGVGVWVGASMCGRVSVWACQCVGVLKASHDELARLADGRRGVAATAEGDDGAAGGGGGGGGDGRRGDGVFDQVANVDVDVADARVVVVERPAAAAAAAQPVVAAATGAQTLQRTVVAVRPRGHRRPLRRKKNEKKTRPNRFVKNDNKCRAHGALRPHKPSSLFYFDSVKLSETELRPS